MVELVVGSGQDLELALMETELDILDAEIMINLPKMYKHNSRRKGLVRTDTRGSENRRSKYYMEVVYRGDLQQPNQGRFRRDDWPFKLISGND